jgi:hypothetical protein
MRDNFSIYYEQVYNQDSPRIVPYGWIQWKGTEVCMDISCNCGASLHADEEFFYHFKCGKCGTIYAVGQVIKLIPLTPEQIKLGEINIEEISTLKENDDDD